TPEIPSRLERRSGQLAGVDEAELVAFGIAAIGAVVVGAVVRPQPRRSLVGAAGLQRRLVRRVDGGTGGCGEAYLGAVAPGGRQPVARQLNHELGPALPRPVPVGGGRAAVVAGRPTDEAQ